MKIFSGNNHFPGNQEMKEDKNRKIRAKKKEKESMGSEVKTFLPENQTRTCTSSPSKNEDCRN